MDLGLFMMPIHPPEKSRTECFEEDIELIVLADELGFKEAWIGQHHSVMWEPIPSNDLFISNLLPRTKNIRLGTGVSILTQHHPVTALHSNGGYQQLSMKFPHLGFYGQ